MGDLKLYLENYEEYKKLFEKNEKPNTIITLLKWSNVNITTESSWDKMVGKAQLQLYNDLKASGANDEDNLLEAEAKYPNCKSTLFDFLLEKLYNKDIKEIKKLGLDK